MFRLRRVTTFIFTFGAPLPPTFVPAGENLNPEFCAEPCSARPAGDVGTGGDWSKHRPQASLIKESTS